MPEQSIQERVVELIVDELPIIDESTITPEARLDSLGDSLDLVKLTCRVEEEFDMSVPDEDAEKLTTVADLIAYIQQSEV